MQWPTGHLWKQCPVIRIFSALFAELCNGKGLRQEQTSVPFLKTWQGQKYQITEASPSGPDVSHLLSLKHEVWLSSFTFWENLSEGMWAQCARRGWTHRQNHGEMMGMETQCFGQLLSYDPGDRWDEYDGSLHSTFLGEGLAAWSLRSRIGPVGGGRRLPLVSFIFKFLYKMEADLLYSSL